jgi:hypothetical protein
VKAIKKKMPLWRVWNLNTLNMDSKCEANSHIDKDQHCSKHMNSSGD